MADQLGEFEGDPVLGTTIKITKAGDGLSKALSVKPQNLHKGDVVHVVLETVVGPIGFVPVKDTDGVQRVHTLETGRATVIDGSLVAEMLDEQDRKLEEAAGITRLPIHLQEAHDRGEHADGLVEGCPACDEEAELAASGQ